MNEPSARPTISTRVARAGFGEHEFCGQHVFTQLAGNTSTAGMLGLALTGRRLSAADCALLDDLVACGAMADPRIWPLKITRILGAYGRLIPAFAGGYLAMEEAAVGAATVEKAAAQLVELRHAVDGRVDDLDAVAAALRALLSRTPQLSGFGVPFRPRDERLEALRRCVHAHRRQLRAHWTLLESLISVLRRGGLKKLEPNVGLAIAAIGLDLGFEGQALSALAAVVVEPCFYANAREAVREPAALLRDLPRSAIAYVGRAPRESPRAHAARRDQPAAGVAPDLSPPAPACRAAGS